MASRGIWVLAGLLFFTCLATCVPAGDTPPRVIRLLNPPEASGSTALIDRARLRDESRYVLPVEAGVPLFESRGMQLPDDAGFEIEVALPPELHAARELVIEASLHGGSGVYDSFRAEPVYLSMADGDSLDSYTLAFELPEKLRGQNAALSIVGYPLSTSAITRLDSQEISVPDGAELRFGYAMAPSTWAPGWAPVRIRAWARVDRSENPRLLIERRIDPARHPHDRRWFDARVDLRPLSGARVQFSFEIEALTDAPEVRIPRTLPLIANPEIRIAQARTPARTRHRPNVVLISLDTLRAQSVSAYGYERETMPALTRRLAAEGALIQRVVTPFPHTTPGHMSMLTGLEPCAHGVLTGLSRLGTDSITLAERFRAAGYRTAAFTEDGAMADGLGYERGFDRYVEHPPVDRFGTAPETFAAARRWIAEPASQPFFVFVHTYEVHGPYTPPRGYASFFEEDSDDEWKQSLLRYDREIRYTDDILDDLLSDLDALGLSDDTLVVVTADHGEEFMEQDFFGHGYALYDESVLVPLLLRFPGHISPGQRIETQVGLIDLAPTILDLLNLEPLSDAQGRSFAKLLTGEGEPFEERPAYSLDRKNHEAVRTSTYKYYRRGEEELLFELERDPGENVNRAEQNPTLLAEGRAALEEARGACVRWRETHARAVAREVDAGTTAELIGKLRALGYIAE